MSTSTSKSSSFITRWSNLTPIGVLVTRCEVLLAALFLLAAYKKLEGIRGPDVFKDSVRAFKVPMGGDLGVRLATSVTPWVEVIAAVLILLGVWCRAAAAVLCLMLVMFLVLIIRAINNGYDLECGCFGDMSPFCPAKVSMCNVIQNSIMLAAALIVAATPRSMLARTARPA